MLQTQVTFRKLFVVQSYGQLVGKVGGSKRVRGAEEPVNLVVDLRMARAKRLRQMRDRAHLQLHMHNGALLLLVLLFHIYSDSLSILLHMIVPPLLFAKMCLYPGEKKQYLI